ncbi:GntR family transcriptional regulator [Burkholderia glumae]
MAKVYETEQALLRTKGMYANVAARLRSMIDEGHLAPGARIDEKAMCEAFDISKTPLREALKVLTAEGRVIHRQYIGYRVAEIDRDDLLATFEVLHGLEAQTGALLATRLTTDHVIAIAAKHRTMLHCYETGRRAEYFKLNQSVHQMIVDAAGNAVLSDIYRTLMAKVYRARGAANADTSRWKESTDEHCEIIAALENGNLRELPSLLREHSERTAAEVTSALDRAAREKP